MGTTPYFIYCCGCYVYCCIHITNQKQNLLNVNLIVSIHIIKKQIINSSPFSKSCTSSIIYLQLCLFLLLLLFANSGSLSIDIPLLMFFLYLQHAVVHPVLQLHPFNNDFTRWRTALLFSSLSHTIVNFPLSNIHPYSSSGFNIISLLSACLISSKSASSAGKVLHLKESSHCQTILVSRMLFSHLKYWFLIVVWLHINLLKCTSGDCVSEF